ncbi:MAG: hypothetical protein K2K40_10175 [Paramuribaculum sp.]|nr:hypothetical protein [Paramuribaculum sp.]
MPQLIHRLSAIIASFAALVMLAACGDSPWDDMPDSVATFVDTYFNEGEVESATKTSTGFVVTFKNGPQITFDSQNDWTDINGRGATLPQMLITDQCPTRVVDYLKDMELTTEVYRLQRSWHLYTVTLSDSYFTYNNQTDELTYPEMRQK